MHFHHLLPSVLTFLTCWYPILCKNLNLAYGRLFLHTLSIFWSHTVMVQFKSSIDDISRFPPLEGPLFTASLKMRQEWRSWLQEILRISSRCVCEWLEIWITLNSVQKCAMPVFDGLLPANPNNDIQSLLFTTAEWHTLAKMRLHTDSMLAWLDESMKAFRKQIQHFQCHTCSFFDTRELPQEDAACSRRQKKAESVNKSYKFKSSCPSTIHSNSCRYQEEEL